MEPETPTPVPDNQSVPAPPSTVPSTLDNGGAPPEPHQLRWMFIGPQGLRAGWSVSIFLVLFISLSLLINWLLTVSHLVPDRSAAARGTITPIGSVIGEGSGVLLMLFVAWIVAKIERRRVSDYNLRGPGRVSRFISGAVTGIVALSTLVACLVAGGWMHFQGMALSGAQILTYGAVWAVAFLFVGCAEEGLMRCFLLFTLGRGLNFWWSLGLVVCMCALVTLNSKANGAWGSYVIAFLGLVPCLILYLKKAPSEGFWDAAWVTSVIFGAGHTGNPGESWVGIFSAAGIGLIFCASIKLTGSVWWAIGCHAAWDWGQSYLYGTPDSGLLAKPHLMNSTYSQQVIWSGGSTGPEGSILILPIMVLIFMVVLLQYGRKRQAPVATAQQTAG